MNDGTTSQIKHIFPDATVTCAAALPTAHVCQRMFDGYTLPQLRSALWRLLAFP